jgi:hypothetical protein
MTQLILTKEYAIAAALKASSTGIFDEKSYKRLFRIFDKLKTHISIAYATNDFTDNNFDRLVKQITSAENNPQVPELELVNDVAKEYNLKEFYTLYDHVVPNEISESDKNSNLFKLLKSSRDTFNTKLAEAIGNKNTKFTFYSIRNYVEAQQLDLKTPEVLHGVLKAVVEAQNFVARNKFEDLTSEDFDKISSLIDDVKELDGKSKSNKPQPANKEVWDKAAKKRGRPAKSKDTVSHVLTEEEKVIAANKLNEKFHGAK